MMLTYTRTVRATRFKGRNYEVVPVSGNARTRVLSAHRNLDHLGSLQEQLEPHCSCFQVYQAGDSGTLVAYACRGSNFVNVAYWLYPIP